MKQCLILFSFLYTSTSWAVFQDIWSAFKGSQTHEVLDTNIEATRLSYLFNVSRNTWNLELSYQDADSRPDAVFPNQGLPTLTTTYTIGLTKNTYSFGSFSLEQGRVEYDLSRWDSLRLSGLEDDMLYETYNQLTYSIDFFDRSYHYQEEVEELQYKANDQGAKWQRLITYRDFALGYIAAKLKVFEKNLAQEFYQRAQTRLNTTVKRVKDRLSRKVEEYQAQAQLAAKKSSKDVATKEMIEAILTLENLIGKNIPKASLQNLSWSKQEALLKLGQHKKTPLKEEQLKYQLEAMKVASKQQKDAAGHKLTLSLSYKTNEIDESLQRTQTLANSQSEHWESVALLKYTIPLDWGRLSDNRKLLAKQTRLAHLELAQFKDEVFLKRQYLEQSLVHLNTAHKAALDQVVLANKVLKEQNKLYLRGQLVFNNVILAEEALLEAKLNEKRMLASLEAALIEKAFWDGQIKAFLNAYRD